MEEQSTRLARAAADGAVTDLRRNESHAGRDTGVLASSQELRFH
jgi:hypothetical protein